MLMAIELKGSGKKRFCFYVSATLRYSEAIGGARMNLS